MRRIPRIFLWSVLALLCFASIGSAAETKFFWGENSTQDVVHGEEGTVQHLTLLSFHRSGVRMSKFKASVPIICVATDNSSSYHDYLLTGASVPNFRIRGNRLPARRFLQAEGDLLLNNVTVEVSGRFRNARRASFKVTIETDDNGEGQSSCYGAIEMTNVRRGARVRD